jgi:hypothetical protein
MTTTALRLISSRRSAAEFAMSVAVLCFALVNGSFYGYNFALVLSSRPLQNRRKAH